jgi:hypothetical protein
MDFQSERAPGRDSAYDIHHTSAQLWLFRPHNAHARALPHDHPVRKQPPGYAQLSLTPPKSSYTGYVDIGLERLFFYFLE